MNENIPTRVELDRFELVQRCDFAAHKRTKCLQYPNIPWNTRPASRATPQTACYRSKNFVDLTNESSDGNDGEGTDSKQLKGPSRDKWPFPLGRSDTNTRVADDLKRFSTDATHTSHPPSSPTESKRIDGSQSDLHTDASLSFSKDEYPTKSRSLARPILDIEKSAGKKAVGRPRKHVAVDDTLPSRSVQDNVVVAVPWSIHKNHNYFWGQKYRDSTFIQQLRHMQPPVWIRNDVDDVEPPQNFEFIGENVFCEGTAPLDPAARSGCSCKPDYRRLVGCEHRSCSCLEDTAPKEDGSPVGFPYHAAGTRKGCLRGIYLDERHAIYECNELCSCSSFCKNKVVQKGRQVPLEIFKTPNRGWGLRSTVALKKGQFIDTYRGEIITNKEANRREEATRDASVPITEGSKVPCMSKESYLFSLDKFEDMLDDDDIYVVDGEYKGGPTRFLNHSCDPNVRQFTVSFYRGHPQVYELAFFAREDIEAFTELTFDYLDSDDGNIERLQKERDVRATPCYCSSVNCRGYLW